MSVPTEQARKKQMNSFDRRVYTVREVARLIGRSEAATYRLVALGQLPAMRIGSRSIVFSRTVIDQLLDGESLGDRTSR
jgi:excisionase family DNA binding protein